VIIILHGKGNQAFFTDSFETKRRKGLEDKNKLTDEEKSIYEISGSDGGGRTNPSTYEIKQFPFPVNPTIRKRKTVDIRKVDPRIGEMSD